MKWQLSARRQSGTIMKKLTGYLALAGLSLVMAGSGGTEALAEKISNPVAVFSGLDKITGRIISFDVYIGETVQFGALQVTPKVCHTRPATESPLTTAFVQVDEITLNNEVRRIFSGWMFADSPGSQRCGTPRLRCLADKLQACLNRAAACRLFRPSDPERRGKGTGSAGRAGRWGRYRTWYAAEKAVPAMKQNLIGSQKK
jgi:hypothetical protein